MSKPWTDPENFYLVEIVGDIPRPMLHNAYNKWAAQHGHPRRTADAIRSQAIRLGLTFTPVGTWITKSEVARTLGVSEHRVNSWGHNYIDFPNRKLGGKSYLYRRDLIHWLRKHPHLLGGIDRQALFLLLEDEDLADEIAATYPFPPGAAPVRRVDTGKIYPSHQAAADDLHVVRSSVTLAIREGRPCAGVQLVPLQPKRLQGIAMRRHSRTGRVRKNAP